jgi:hypothetical protein
MNEMTFNNNVQHNIEKILLGVITFKIFVGGYNLVVKSFLI